jgi:hypothetical protein
VTDLDALLGDKFDEHINNAMAQIFSLLRAPPLFHCGLMFHRNRIANGIFSVKIRNVAPVVPFLT